LIRLVTSGRVMSVVMSRLNFTFNDLELLRLDNVHAEGIFEVLGSFAGL